MLHREVRAEFSLYRSRSFSATKNIEICRVRVFIYLIELRTGLDELILDRYQNVARNCTFPETCLLQLPEKCKSIANRHLCANIVNYRNRSTSTKNRRGGGRGQCRSAAAWHVPSSSNRGHSLPCTKNFGQSNWNLD